MFQLAVTVNGIHRTEHIDPRMLLSDFIRNRLGLTGTHVGCEHGYCGSCTVLLDGESARSCLTLAAQVNGRHVDTVESLAPDEQSLHPVQQAFKDCHGLQCGFCTPGLLMSVVELAAEDPGCNRDEIRHRLAGNICRCTGYHHIVDAVEQVLATSSEDADDR